MGKGTHRNHQRTVFDPSYATDRGEWSTQLEAELRSDPTRLFEISRRITGYLVQSRAYDFRDEWSDLVQEVLLALLVALRRGTIQDPSALYGYLRSVTRHKLADHLRKRMSPEGRNRLPWDDVLERDLESFTPSADLTLEVRRALEKLPEKRRRVIFGVYGEGKSYQSVADETGIPLGSVKRYLRQGLAELRTSFGTELNRDEPLQPAPALPA